MGLTLVTVDGERVSAGCAAALVRLNEAFRAQFGLELRVSSGYRSTEEQTAIFLERFHVQDEGDGPFGDVRYWNDQRWVRHSSEGTVAAPGTSRHERSGAVDLRDTGSDPGVTTEGTVRSDWLRANGPSFGFQPTGFGFGEAWHYDYDGPQDGPATTKGPATTEGAAQSGAQTTTSEQPRERAMRDSVVRTFTPWLVGALIGWLISLGWEIDDTWRTLITVATALVISMIYYAVVRFLETKVAPRFGWLLGVARSPNYHRRR
ncbi:hypothetical protein GCM10025768_04640 [Microbacterium pseudoresistens]|uniref:D-alanyl-D-alanine carboxypeptidase-like core domain-containing protein n=1 Tax=Microbacterium pseudoresistens TaxID=640634 RepID=A0A7Y9EUQ2_9MICO|nr:M15 family metallopeptidase [Microbacterium pseudoresistens]NYD54300.1 hypothetical protein [Microbacterium pseudoresistens]